MEQPISAVVSLKSSGLFELEPMGLVLLQEVDLDASLEFCGEFSPFLFSSTSSVLTWQILLVFLSREYRPIFIAETKQNPYFIARED